MNGREYFHESVVKDIVDILTDLKDFDEVQFINNANAKRSFKSITSATKDLILTFPVMVSTDIDPDNAIMIAKAQEKKMASLLHILFTAISVGNNEDVFDYVRKFHSNVGSMSGSLDSYADSLDKLATTFGESYDQTLRIDKDVLNTILEELKESNYTLPDDTKKSSLESFKIVPGYRTGYNDMIIQEVSYTKDNDLRGAKASLADFGFKLNNTTETDIIDAFDSGKFNNFVRYDRDGNQYTVDDLRSIALQNWATLQPDNFPNIDQHRNTSHVERREGGFTTTRINDKFEADNLEIMRDLEAKGDYNSLSPEDKRKYDAAKKALDNYRNSKERDQSIQQILQRDNRPKAVQDKDMAEYMAKITDAHSKVVLNNEYKKANELQPTMMVVNFMRHSEETGDYINTAVIGIKCKIYPVSSSDIVNRISGKLNDKSFLTNFVRATTNEIAFFRDFLFAVDQAKIDAKSYGRQASSNKLWKVLERRSTKSKFRRSLKMYNDATAISTLVMSENDADYLKKVHSIDILDVRHARKIMDSYNFMCLVVCNQSTEVASFLYDTGDDTFEMIPFSGLEREASDNSYKKMVNLLSKVSR